MPPTTRSATAAARKPTANPKEVQKPARKPNKPKAAQKPSRKPATKPTKPKGVQKPARQPRRKITQADIDALAPLPWPFPNYTYLELQPPNEDEIEENNGFVYRHVKKAKRNYNGSEFKISEGAYERLRNMYLEIEKRTPESNGITHIFEDYRGLGTMEVIENEITSYVKELRRAQPSYFTLFQIAETLAIFFSGTYDAVWFHVDDSVGIERLTDLLGALFVDSFRRLDIDCHPLVRLVSEAGPLRNLGLVMGLAVRFAEDEGKWWEEVVRMAKKRGMVMRDEKGVVEVEVGPKEEQEMEEVDFLDRVAQYKKGGKKLGGRHYDLTVG